MTPGSALGSENSLIKTDTPGKRKSGRGSPASSGRRDAGHGIRRARLLLLTPAGQAVLAEAVPIWRSLHAAIESSLSDPALLRSELNLLSKFDGQHMPSGNVGNDV